MEGPLFPILSGVRKEGSLAEPTHRSILTRFFLKCGLGHFSIKNVGQFLHFFVETNFISLHELFGFLKCLSAKLLFLFMKTGVIALNPRF